VSTALSLDSRFVSLLNRFRIAPEKQRQRRSSGPGAHLSKGLGQSLDFSEYRPYQPGDDLRALDWKVFGRTDRLYTKLYVPEQEETVCFVIDCSGSMLPKWDFLQTTVMGLASVALGQGDRVALRFLARLNRPGHDGMAPQRGRSGLARVAQFLEATSPAGQTDLDEAFSDLARRFKSRTHLVVLSDFLQEGAGLPGLAQLHYRRHRLSLLQLLSPEEVEPEREIPPGEWELLNPEPDQPDPQHDMVRLDLGRSAFVHYTRELQAHNAELRAFARSTGSLYISARSDTPAMEYFSQGLRQGGLLV
jgi:uncharacterized protein (DUF58 family)